MRDSLRDAFRACRADPWTTLTIVVTLGIGTGVNAAVLALVYGILLRPLPYREPSRLFVIDEEMRLSQLASWSAALQTADSIAAYAPAQHVLRGLGAPRVVQAAFVSDNLFEVLGLGPAKAAAARGDASPVGVFVSERTARILDVAPESLVGRSVSVAGLTLPIVAVLPAAVAFPAEGTELWIPASAAPPVTIKGQEDARWFKLVARIKPGVSVPQFVADATRVRALLSTDDGPPRPRREPKPAAVKSIRDGLYGDSRPLLTAFFLAAAIVLIVACANVSTLLLGRTAGREQELSLRLALGAGQARLVGILFAEGVLLAGAGSALGIGLAAGALRMLRSTAASGLPRLDAVTVDWPVLLMALGVASLVSIASTVGPALCVRRTEAASLVRAPSLRGLAARRRLSNGFVVSQIALATVLVVSSSLLARSIVRLMAVDIGVNAEHAVAMRLMLADTMRLVTDRGPFVTTLLDRVRAAPGVTNAGIGTGLPPDHGEIEMAIRLVDQNGDRTHRMSLVAVSPGFLEALGARLIAGRTIAAGDVQGDGGPVVVISRSVAGGLFPNRAAVGQELPSRGMGTDPRHPRVIGVVDDVHYTGLDAAAGGALYMPWSKLPLGVVSLVIRTTGDPRLVIPAVRRIVSDLDPALAVEGVRPLDQLAAQSIAERRVQLVVASAFAALTLILSVLGLVAALLRAVGERRQELAIRAALGGTPQQIGRMVLAGGTRLTVIGLALGVVAAFGATRLLGHALYGVSATDLATFATVAAGMLAISTTACLIPALRAARADPSALLRS